MSDHIEKVYEELGRNVTRCRHEARLTQMQLSRLIGLTRASVANIETGRQRVLLHQAFEIAAALNVALSDLVPGFGPGARDIIRLDPPRRQRGAA